MNLFYNLEAWFSNCLQNEYDYTSPGIVTVKIIYQLGMTLMFTEILYSKLFLWLFWRESKAWHIYSTARAPVM